MAIFVPKLVGFTTGVYSVGLTSVHTLPQYFPGIESKISLAVMERIINGQECWLPEGTRIYYKWPEWLPVGKKERIINGQEWLPVGKRRGL